MSLVTQALVGAVLGIFAGLFFGEDCAILQPLGSLYVMGLESVMYPVVICSIIGGLARLTPEVTSRLLRRGWVFLVGAWGLTLTVIWMLSFALPPPAPSMVGAHADSKSVALLDMLVPGNLFVDLQRNFLPAVVVFSVVYGLALQKSKNKQALLDVLEVIYDGGLKVWSMVVRLAPLGVFALMAVTAGTVRLAVLPALIAYLVLFAAGAMLIAFFFLPWLLEAMAPVSYRDVVTGMRAPVAMTLATTLPVVSLPYIQELTRQTVARCGIEDGDDVGKTVLSVLYGLAQLGNCFVYFVILFASFNFQHALTVGQQFLLPPVVLLSAIGTPTATINAVSFLTGWLGMPADVFNFYVSMMSFTRYPQIVLTVTGFHFITILVVLSYYGRLQIRRGQLALRLGIIVVMLGVVGVLARSLEPHLLNDTQQSLATHSLAGAHVEPVNYSVVNDTFVEQGEALTLTARRGVLRVGINMGSVPFVYHNAAGQLVGHDVAYACELARSLGCSVQFVPFEWTHLHADLAAGRFDVAMSGVYVDAQRLTQVLFSDSYFEDALGLLSRPPDTRSLDDYAALREAPLRIAVSSSPVLVELLQRFFPRAQPVQLDSYDALPSTPCDVALWTREQARAWAAMHPGFVVVEPRGLDYRVMCAYVCRTDSPRMQTYLNYWLRLEQAAGFAASQRSYWIEGKNLPTRRRRWCILHDVLHWGTSTAN